MKLPMVIGITGKSGGGKSTVCRELAARGYCVVDCDAVAREVQEKGGECLAELVREFSAQILLPDGSLDRKKLGELCFNDETGLRRLNEICHPRILARLDAEIAACPSVCIIEAGALFESGFDRRCDRIIAVVCDEALSVARLCERDGITPEAARARLAAQFPTERLIERSDCVIFNDGTLERLSGKIDTLEETIKIWIKEET